MSEGYKHDAETPAQHRTAPGEQIASDGEVSRQPETTGEAGERPAEPPQSSPPPRGLKPWIVISVLLALGAAVAVGVFFGDPIRAGLGKLEETVLVGDAHDHSAEDDGQYWTCGMHPWVILPEPGLCPICHMELTPLDPDKLAGEISIDPVVVQNIGVRIAPVTVGPLQKEVRTVGTVAYNEQAVRVVNTKIGGWIEELYVDETGVLVEEGAPLFELYSPELFAAQQEYLSAYRNRGLPGGEELLQASRTRLEYFDISEEQIRRLQETSQPTKTLTITSPHTGVVTEKMANEGMRIEPGMRVYQIADLSTVWVQATVYEQDLPYVQVGQKATMLLPYLPGERFEGEVAYVYPYLNEQARQVRVRLEFPNPEGLLKPGMFATVRLDRTLDQRAVLIPRDAVVTTGERAVAFVSLGEGRFEPRDVELGVETEQGMVEVLDGLEPGEQVVISGQFMLDSESKMRLALAKMIQGDLATEQVPRVPLAEASVLPSLPEAAEASLVNALNAYFAIGDALEQDTLEGVDERAQAVTASLAALTETPIAGRPSFWEELQGVIAQAREGARAVADASELENARFAYATLGDAIDRLLLATGVPPSYGVPVHRFVCGFLEEAPRRGIWLQPGGEPSNPLMGEASGMLECQVPAEHRVLPTTGSAADLGPPGVQQPRPGASGSDRSVATGRLPATAAGALEEVLASYLSAGEKLVTNSTAGLAADAHSLADALDALREIEVAGDIRFWVGREELATARGEAVELAEADDLSAARLIYADLSRALAGLLEDTGIPLIDGDRVAVLSCPMFPPGEGGAVWLQPAGPARNPYMGEGPMLRCAAGDAPLLPLLGGEGATPAVEDAGEAIPAAAVSDALRAATGGLVERYLAIHRALASGEAAAARHDLQAVRVMALELAESQDAEVRTLAEQVAAEAASQPADLPALRAAFKSLSEAVIDLVERVPPASGGPLYRGYCPMARASWLQTSAEVQNPYYGVASDMYDCGELKPVRP